VNNSGWLVEKRQDPRSSTLVNGLDTVPEFPASRLPAPTGASTGAESTKHTDRCWLVGACRFRMLRPLVAHPKYRAVQQPPPKPSATPTRRTYSRESVSPPKRARKPRKTPHPPTVPNQVERRFYSILIPRWVCLSGCPSNPSRPVGIGIGIGHRHSRPSEPSSPEGLLTGCRSSHI
jgi:hypothetical protein